MNNNSRASWAGQPPYQQMSYAEPARYTYSSNAPAPSSVHQPEQPYRPHSNVYEEAPPLPSRVTNPYMDPPSLPPRPHSTTSSSRPVSSVPAAYQAEVQQNHQGWPQHVQYSSEPASHNYEPQVIAGNTSITPATAVVQRYGAPLLPPKIPGYTTTPAFGARPSDMAVEDGAMNHHMGRPSQGTTSNSQYIHQSFPASQQNETRYSDQSLHNHTRPFNPVTGSSYQIPSVLPGPPPGPPPDTPPAVNPQYAGAGMNYLGRGEAPRAAQKLAQPGQIPAPYPEHDLTPGMQRMTSDDQMRPGVEHQHDPVSPLHKASVDSGRGSAVSHVGISSPPSRSASLVSRMSSATPFRPPVSPQVDGDTLTQTVSRHTHHASAFNFGGPSDWQHFGAAGEDEIDDTELYGEKNRNAAFRPHIDKPVELAAASPPLSTIRTDLGESQCDPSTQLKTPRAVFDPSSPARHDERISDEEIKAQSRERNDQHVITHHGGKFHERHMTEPETMTASPEPVNAQPVFSKFGDDRAAHVTPAAIHSREPFLQGRIDELEARNSFLQSTVEELQEEMATSKQSFEDLDAELASLQQSMTQAYQQLDAKGLELAEFRIKADGDLRSSQAQLAEARTLAATTKEDSEREIARLSEGLAQMGSQAQTMNEEHENKARNLSEAKHAMELELADLKSKFDNAIKHEADTRQELENLVDQVKTEEQRSVRIPDELDTPLQESLRRYLDALAKEAVATSAQDRLKIFQDFISNESRLRGIEPPLKAHPRGRSNPENNPVTHGKDLTGSKTLSVEIPSDSARGGAEQYSPGGRPVLAATGSQRYSPGGRPIMDATEQYSPGGRPLMRSYPKSAHPGDRRPLTVKEASENPKSAGSPEGLSKLDSQTYRPVAHSKQSTQTHATTDHQLLRNERNSKPSENITLDVPKPRQNSAAVPVGDTARVHSPSSDAPIPVEFDEPALSMALRSSASKPGQSTSMPPYDASSISSYQMQIEQLLVQPSAANASLNSLIQQVRENVSSYTSDFSFLQQTIKRWEAGANEKRKRLEADRRKRVEQEEARISELYNNNEIGYADIGILEDEGKAAEAGRQVEEEQAEYESYSSEVFQPMYDRLLKEIMSIVTDYQTLERAIQEATSDLNTTSGKMSSPADLPAALDLITEISRDLELRHKHLNQCVTDRDRRYRRTQVRPLYARGEIQQMKKLERSFEIGERRANVKAAVGSADRCKRLWTLVDDCTSRGVEADGRFTQQILHLLSTLKSDTQRFQRQLPAGLTEQIQMAVQARSDQSRALFSRFEKMEMELNDIEFAASVAQTRLETLVKNESADAAKAAESRAVGHLSSEKEKEDKRLDGEAQKRMAAIDQGLLDALKAIRSDV